MTPKAMCQYLYDDFTIRQALEKMEAAKLAALPILNRRGEYRGTLTEGDLLWAMKNMCYLDMRQAEARRIMEIDRRRDNIPVRVTTSMHELLDRATVQNFVPVVDDKDTFIGIVTRTGIMQYCKQELVVCSCHAAPECDQSVQYSEYVYDPGHKGQFCCFVRLKKPTVHPCLRPVRHYYNIGVNANDYFRMLMQ